ncbi:DUF4173 domain-containing protein [Streptomyces sp. 35G-GA-8]|uniref:DUF4153 domain-containing protein n=1 Tax=Streptomyces sp. 35G-GA-8 TaxID=2939434 RepID=UPI00201F0AEB|nr:DUF4173 domain-containing protein [Streptomyces sp. 35G-GA-8]MCL7381141.1 DUF4173 domain-containing protein [Streptomyces sp. 35G-GA-8]
MTDSGRTQRSDGERGQGQGQARERAGSHGQGGARGPGEPARRSSAGPVLTKQRQGAPPPPDWQQWQPQRSEPPRWLTEIQPRAAAPIRVATLWSVLASALLSALLLGDGLGLNLLIVVVPPALAAYFAAQAAGRRPRAWTLAWAFGGIALLAVPVLRDAGLPTFLAVVSALALGSLALHGCRTWPGVVFGPLGLLGSLGPGTVWGWRGLRARVGGSRGRLMPVVRAVGVAAVLLIVFGTLFANADAAFADLLGQLSPDVSVGDGPWRFLLFVIGLVGALGAAHTAAAPLRWDRITVPPGRARGRMEWALPLIVLNLLFAAFIAIQLAVLFGGYDKVLRETGLTYAEYARQGFWQLLWATVLVLLVIGLARRWAPRDGAGDATLVRAVLGVLCVLTLVVVAAALRRMDLYVDAYGLTRLRVSVAAMELWLGVVIVLILVAGAVGGRWLPRAVAASAGAAVLAYGLISPDALVAERNVQRYERSHKIDIEYFQELSADAAPALDRLPEPLRSCALAGIARNLGDASEPWYATSWSESRAREIVATRKIDPSSTCYGLGRQLDRP